MAASGYGIFLVPRATSDEPAIGALSEATGFSHVDAKMILASRIPRQIHAVETVDEARDHIRRLRSAGLDGFVVSVKALSRVRVPRVQAARLGPDGVKFEPEGGFRPGELKLILHGEILSETEERHNGARGLRGMRVPVQRTTHDRSSDSEQFALFYGDSHDKAVELRSRSFDFHCLGKDFGYAGSVNLGKLIERLRGLFPEARYDDTLMKCHPMVDEVAVTRMGDLGQSVIRRQGNEDGVSRAALLLAISVLRR